MKNIYYQDEQNFVKHINCTCEKKKIITQKFFLGVLKLGDLEWNMDKIKL